MHIVLVDGSRTGLMILYRMLEPRGDTIVMFTDGRQALDYIRATPEADVLITSFEVGTISGSELCWETRILADAGRPLYVIALSASTDPQYAVGVLDAGADDFMSKPPRLDELAGRLRVAERTIAMQHRLIEMATIDPLSGLLNRRAFLERTDPMVVEAASGLPVSLILFDLDHFKRINDVYGHDTGDQVLKHIGKLKVPPDAVFARVGGKEFAVMLFGIPLDAALSVADHTRAQIAALEIDSGDQIATVTASFGVAELGEDKRASALYQAADAALNHAKHSGRNRVISASAPLV